MHKLTSLEGGPSRVGHHFDCEDNLLTSMEGAPSYIGGSLFCGKNHLLTSLKNIHLYIKNIGSRYGYRYYAYFRQTPIRSNVLGLLLIDNLAGVEMWPADVGRILNKHLPSEGMESVLLCQEELILAGFEEYAQL